MRNGKRKSDGARRHVDMDEGIPMPTQETKQDVVKESETAVLLPVVPVPGLAHTNNPDLGLD